MVLTEYGNVTDYVAGVLASQMLPRGDQTIFMEKLMDAKTMPKNKGQVIKFARMLSAIPAARLMIW